MENYINTTDRRRSIRIGPLSLAKTKLDGIDRPSIKIAETMDEWEQAFSLVYQEYLRMGFITEADSSQLYCNIYHMLPTTRIFVFKSYISVIATLTQIFDSQPFGLPIDSLYHEELNALREQGRKLAELSTLASSRQNSRRNIFMYLFRAIFWLSIYSKVNDLCIMVNPRHVKFYKSILFFEDLGEQKCYPKVNAPAVALRLNLDDIEGKLKENYSALDFDTDLHSFYHRVIGTAVEDLAEEHHLEKIKVMDADTVKYFFIEKTNILSKAPPEAKEYIKSVYPGLQ